MNLLRPNEALIRKESNKKGKWILLQLYQNLRYDNKMDIMIEKWRYNILGISINYASYGGNCNGYDQTETLGNVCNGKDNCKYYINHVTIGDPCPGVSKAYAVSYRCGDEDDTLYKIISSEASGKTLKLDCSNHKGIFLSEINSLNSY